jgi:rod shape-determining protein MreD
MNRAGIIQSFHFILFVLLQVLIFNNIQLTGYVNPFVYIIVILQIPFSMPGWLLMILAFFIGLTIDIFSDTPGLHSFACVSMAFFRPFVINSLYTREDIKSLQPNALTMGTNRYLYYVLLLTLIHHLSLFYMEVFRFSGFWSTMLRVLLSTFFTTFLIFIFQMFLFRNKKQNA